MCNFFSLVSAGDGKPLYFDAKIRKKILNGEIKCETDSHTSIADYFGYKAAKEDGLNKYEYNPLTKKFVIDQLNTLDDSKEIEEFCKKLNFKTVVPGLIIKPILNPFLHFKNTKVTKADIKNLKKWASVRASVVDSVGASVWDSVVGASVRDSVVGASVRDSVVGASVRDSVWDSVWDSVVRASVWDSVRASVVDSVWAYISTFFDINCPLNLMPSIKLWNKGLVPSFDGKVWRLHGYKGKIIFEISQKELTKGEMK